MVFPFTRLTFQVIKFCVGGWVVEWDLDFGLDLGLTNIIIMNNFDENNNKTIIIVIVIIFIFSFPVFLLSMHHTQPCTHS